MLFVVMISEPSDYMMMSLDSDYPFFSNSFNILKLVTASTQYGAISDTSSAIAGRGGLARRMYVAVTVVA